MTNHRFGASTLCFALCGAVQGKGGRFPPQGGNSSRRGRHPVRHPILGLYRLPLELLLQPTPFFAVPDMPLFWSTLLPIPRFLETLISTRSFSRSFSVHPLQGPEAAGSWLSFQTHLPLLPLPIFCSSLPSPVRPTCGPSHACARNHSAFPEYLPLPCFLPRFLPIPPS